MAIKCQRYLITFHPIKLHIFLSKLYLTNSSISAVFFTANSEVSHFHKQTLNIAYKALCVSNIFDSVAFMKYFCYLIKLKNKMTDNLMIQAGLDFHYMFVDVYKTFLVAEK